MAKHRKLESLLEDILEKYGEVFTFAPCFITNADSEARWGALTLIEKSLKSKKEIVWEWEYTDFSAIGGEPLVIEFSIDGQENNYRVEIEKLINESGFKSFKGSDIIVVTPLTEEPTKKTVDASNDEWIAEKVKILNEKYSGEFRALTKDEISKLEKFLNKNKNRSWYAPYAVRTTVGNQSLVVRSDSVTGATDFLFMSITPNNFKSLTGTDIVEKKADDKSITKSSNGKMKDQDGDEKQEIKAWYVATYPSDDLGLSINSGISFEDLFETLDSYGDVYKLLGDDVDSVIRERVFSKLSEIMGVPYEEVYDQWLKAGSHTLNDSKKQNDAKTNEEDVVKESRVKAEKYVTEKGFGYEQEKDNKAEIARAINFMTLLNVVENKLEIEIWFNQYSISEGWATLASNEFTSKSNEKAKNLWKTHGKYLTELARRLNGNIDIIGDFVRGDTRVEFDVDYPEEISKQLNDDGSVESINNFDVDEFLRLADEFYDGHSQRVQTPKDGVYEINLTHPWDDAEYDLVIFKVGVVVTILVEKESISREDAKKEIAAFITKTKLGSINDGKKGKQSVGGGKKINDFETSAGTIDAGTEAKAKEIMDVLNATAVRIEEKENSETHHLDKAREFAWVDNENKQLVSFNDFLTIYSYYGLLELLKKGLVTNDTTISFYYSASIGGKAEKTKSTVGKHVSILGSFLKKGEDAKKVQQSKKKIGDAINFNKHVWEGWTVQDFIDELEPVFNQIMSGRSWQKPFKDKEELKRWCMDNQPGYKKYIPEVVEYFVKKMARYKADDKKSKAQDEKTYSLTLTRQDGRQKEISGTLEELKERFKNTLAYAKYNNPKSIDTLIRWVNEGLRVQEGSSYRRSYLEKSRTSSVEDGKKVGDGKGHKFATKKNEVFYIVDAEGIYYDPPEDSNENFDIYADLSDQQIVEMLNDFLDNIKFELENKFDLEVLGRDFLPDILQNDWFVINIHSNDDLGITFGIEPRYIWDIFDLYDIVDDDNLTIEEMEAKAEEGYEKTQDEMFVELKKLLLDALTMFAGKENIRIPTSAWTSSSLKDGKSSKGKMKDYTYGQIEDLLIEEARELQKSWLDQGYIEEDNIICDMVYDEDDDECFMLRVIPKKYGENDLNDSKSKIKDTQIIVNTKKGKSTIAKLEKDIENAKDKLKRSKFKENFGQVEVRKLLDKYQFVSDVSPSEQKLISQMINKFEAWCQNYSPY